MTLGSVVMTFGLPRGASDSSLTVPERSRGDRAGVSTLRLDRDKKSNCTMRWSQANPCARPIDADVRHLPAQTSRSLSPESKNECSVRSHTPRWMALRGGFHLKRSNSALLESPNVSALSNLELAARRPVRTAKVDMMHALAAWNVCPDITCMSTRPYIHQESSPDHCVAQPCTPCSVRESLSPRLRSSSQGATPTHRRNLTQGFDIDAANRLRPGSFSPLRGGTEPFPTSSTRRARTESIDIDGACRLRAGSFSPRYMSSPSPITHRSSGSDAWGPLSSASKDPFMSADSRPRGAYDFPCALGRHKALHEWPSPRDVVAKAETAFNHKHACRGSSRQGQGSKPPRLSPGGLLSQIVQLPFSSRRGVSPVRRTRPDILQVRRMPRAAQNDGTPEHVKNICETSADGESTLAVPSDIDFSSVAFGTPSQRKGSVIDGISPVSTAVPSSDAFTPPLACCTPKYKEESCGDVLRVRGSVQGRLAERTNSFQAEPPPEVIQSRSPSGRNVNNHAISRSTGVASDNGSTGNDERSIDSVAASGAPSSRSLSPALPSCPPHESRGSVCNVVDVVGTGFVEVADEDAFMAAESNLPVVKRHWCRSSDNLISTADTDTDLICRILSVP